MKKVFSLLLAGLLCLSILLSVTSCGTKHPIEAFKDKVETAGNYQMTITMSDIPLFGTISMTIKVDGNIEYASSLLSDEGEYTEIVGDAKYSYTKNYDGTWSKELVTDEEDDNNVIDDETMEPLFNPNNYEKVKDKANTYKQKKDVSFDDFEDVVITVEDDSCTIEMVSIEGGYGVKLVISKIGKIKLTLPTVA